MNAKKNKCQQGNQIVPCKCSRHLVNTPVEQNLQCNHVVNIQQHVGHCCLWSICYTVDGHRLPAAHFNDPWIRNRQQIHHLSSCQEKIWNLWSASGSKGCRSDFVVLLFVYFILHTPTHTSTFRQPLPNRASHVSAWLNLIQTLYGLGLTDSTILTSGTWGSRQPNVPHAHPRLFSWSKEKKM